ncbi:glutamine--fructose-6-phosphate transaminase (isomerizing) [Nocardia sp. NPDC051832]|uniref:glutamine--fructose-6-phosphate transaminase (isomerizing) n=1 Tax=Nocardia sp. NPDC051832 TaxID=3155673 RepID=UPI0034392F72
MCGIAGTVGTRAQTELVRMMHSLEYRGYDSAGICLIDNGRIVRHRASGRVTDLERTLPGSTATTGIGHTRWATHGPPSERNAHPHLSSDHRIAVVHNGTLHNATALRARLAERGIVLSSDTDSEVLAHLIRTAVGTGVPLSEAVRDAVALVDGSYAVLAIDRTLAGTIVATTNGGSLLVGTGPDGVRVASDLAALSGRCDHYRSLRAGEIVSLTPHGVVEHDQRAPEGRWQPLGADRTAEFTQGGFADFMAKEIHEQRTAAQRFLDVTDEPAESGGWQAYLDRSGIRRVKFLGCGSSYYAGQLGAHFVESLARIPADAEPATEFRYRDPLLDESCLYVLISQSGETLDTLVAGRFLRERGMPVLGVVNVADSALARESDARMLLRAGPEISVASTKVFTNMGLAFLALAAHLAQGDDAELPQLQAALSILPGVIGDLIDNSDAIQRAATEFSDFAHMYFIGRAGMWPIAREGAQKLKEISYIHAEAYQASELKHGPLALVGPELASVVLVPRDDNEQRNRTTVEQIQARRGRVLVVTQGDSADFAGATTVRVPVLHPYLDHLLMNIALQLFAYHAARALGRDVDRPRNLAKSVTVE